MNKTKRILAIVFSLGSMFLFSACSLPLTNSSSSLGSTPSVKTGSFLKSEDNGKSWVNKIKISDTQNIGLTNALSIAVDPQNDQNIYLGTEKDGLYVTKNGADTWEKINFPLTKIYSLAMDKNNTNIIYASGILGKRAKIFKSMNGGSDWNEIYTEPSDGSTVSSLEISKKNSNVLYSGTSDGMIFKTSDGGQTWKNLLKADGPIIDISFDSVKDDAVYFGVFGGSVLRTLDGGNTIDDFGKIRLDTVAQGAFLNWNTYSLAVDPTLPGVLYVGMANALLRGTDYGENWEKVNILESSKKAPIRAIAVNLQNSKEIMYSSAGAMYVSIDAGENWFIFQLNTDKVVEVIRYSPINANIVYAGLRKI